MITFDDAYCGNAPFGVSCWKNNRLNIIIIGCGGVGSRIVPEIARLAHNINNKLIKSLEYIDNVSICLVDGDVVEQKNILRQNFIFPDIDKNKAIVLASRYGNAHDIAISAIDKFVDETNTENLLDYERGNIIISGVDNVKCRSIIHDFINSSDDGKGAVDAWIDVGNMRMHGQVVLSTVGFFDELNVELTEEYLKNVYERNVIINTPTFIDLFGREEVEEIPCEEAANLNAQSFNVNATGAVLAINYLMVYLNNMVNDTKIQTPLVTKFSTSNVFECMPLNVDFLRKVVRGTNAL